MTKRRTKLEQELRRLEEEQEELHFRILMDDCLTRTGDACEQAYSDASASGRAEAMPRDRLRRLYTLLDDAPSTDRRTPPKPDPTSPASGQTGRSASPGSSPSLRGTEHVSAVWALRSARVSGAVRLLGTAALTLVLVLATLVTVQAAGINILGALGAWTDEVFHFDHGKELPTVTEAPAEEDWLVTTPNLEILRDSLRQKQYPSELIPTWLPEDYVVTGAETASDAKLEKETAYFGRKGETVRFSFTARYYASDPTPFSFPADAEHREEVEVRGKLFSVFQSGGRWIGVWADRRYSVEIETSEGRELLLGILNSLGQPLDLTRPTDLEPLREELLANGFPAQMIPAWLPEGYTNTELYTTDNVVHLLTTASYNKNGKTAMLSFICGKSPSYFEGQTFCKDPGDPEEITLNGKRFYLFTNTGSWVGVWQDGLYELAVEVDEDREVLIDILKSIGGRP